MIDQKTISVVEERVAQELEDRRGVFAREVSQIKERMNAKGALYSGATVGSITAAVGNEFRVRASLIWYAFARALDAQGIRLSQETVMDVKRRLETMLASESGDLAKYCEELRGIARGPVHAKSAEELRRSAAVRICNEIDYTALRQSTSSQRESGVVNIYQSYGIVQTGDRSSASININIGSEEIHEIEKALESVKQALEESRSLSPDRRSETLELVSDVTNEIKRPKPNSLRIRGALQAIASTVQTMAAASEAYQLLKGAASMLGLHLP
ncbi:MAG TPA: hypothetical protein VMX13_09695 [Sedimentisphaerales bacterium]|nr:hypothetical protein [Sedimentisphaerales bacterium]